MKKLVFGILSLSISLNALSQKSAEQTLILNNGPALTGIIIGDSADYYKVKLLAPQIVNVPKNNISSVVNAGVSGFDRSYRGGYYIHISTSVLAGKGENDQSVNPSLHLSNGIQFMNGLGFGVGTGIEEMNMFLIPAFAEISYHPFDSRVSPYVFMKSGYSFSLMKDEKATGWYGYNRSATGGLLFNAGVGILLHTSERFGINIGLGYRYQKTSITESNYYNVWSDYATHYVTDFNRFEIQLGFVFR
jgi:hypothetical protein